jgi:hypothetical protein
VKHARRSGLGQLAVSVFLAPWLLLGLWLEVVVGTQAAWANFVGYVSPAQPNITAGLCFLAATLVGPVLVIVATIRTRHRVGTGSRLLRIECWSLPVVCPLGVLALGLLAASAVI